ncbi:sensor histidine kinase [Radiobacillus sp. PE A8.2]|uniref:sensor histidine kinase n=1 Tax=Radiobacillus sp. PE A8.2 TaxID=3380349 RepID=UPI00388EAAFE
MKSVINRSVINGVTVSFVLLIMFGSLFFIAFPVADWKILWERHIFEVPFLILVLLVAILAGVISGLSTGLYWRKQLKEIQDTIDDISQGKPQDDRQLGDQVEFIDLLAALRNIEKQIIEQKRRSQKLISERVEDQEKRINEVILEERNRLARELHDSVSQELFAASMMMSAINESNPNLNEVASKQLQQVEVMIQQSQLEMRALLLHLRPVALRGKSLTEGIKLLLAELQQKVPMEIDCQVEEVNLNKGIEDHLFRILQESVSNTLRHAKAGSFDVKLMARNGMIILTVIDDGVGFNLEEKENSSYGIQNMKERAAEVGATIRIISVPNKGTRLEVRVPMIDAEGESDD